MGLEPEGSSVVYDPRQQNEKTKKMKYTYDYKGHKMPNV